MPAPTRRPIHRHQTPPRPDAQAPDSRTRILADPRGAARRHRHVRRAVHGEPLVRPLPRRAAACSRAARVDGPRRRRVPTRDRDGAPGRRSTASSDFTPADPPHGWDAGATRSGTTGANDGFVSAHAGADAARRDGLPRARAAPGHLRARRRRSSSATTGSRRCSGRPGRTASTCTARRRTGSRATLPVARASRAIFERLDDAGISAHATTSTTSPGPRAATCKLAGIARHRAVLRRRRGRHAAARSRSSTRSSSAPAPTTITPTTTSRSARR